MNNSVQNLINDLEALRGATVRVFGQPTTLPEKNEYLLVDAVDFLYDLRRAGCEADLTMTKIDDAEIERIEAEIEELKEQLECLDAGQEEEMDRLEILIDSLYDDLRYAEDNWIEAEADSIDEYLEYLDGVYGLDEVHSGNTYNAGGNITNDYYIHEYKCGDGYYYATLAFHRYGDVRCNYTDEVLLRFDDECELYEVLSEAGYTSVSLEINDTEYVLDIRADYEEITVNVVDADGCYEDCCYIYGCFTEDEAKQEIIEKLGLEIEEEKEV